MRLRTVLGFPKRGRQIYIEIYSYLGSHSDRGRPAFPFLCPLYEGKFDKLDTFINGSQIGRERLNIHLRTFYLVFISEGARALRGFHLSPLISGALCLLVETLRAGSHNKPLKLCEFTESRRQPRRPTRVGSRTRQMPWSLLLRWPMRDGSYWSS